MGPPGPIPALYGVGLVSQREPDPSRALEPLQLMINAALSAGEDSGAPDLLRRVDAVYVPQGRWRYRNPGAAIAAAIGAGSARSILGKVGVLQHSLLSDAARSVAAGEMDVALIVGGETGHRDHRARSDGVAVHNAEQADEPDEVLRPASPLVDPIELATLGPEAAAYYAVLESAYRHRAGWSVDDSRDRIASLYAAFSRMAVANPHGWTTAALSAGEIRAASDSNRMVAFPYTTRHVSFLHVDQATALLLCSTTAASQAGVTSTPVFPSLAVESNHGTPLGARADLGRSAGITAVANATLEYLGGAADRIDVFDLYSCFPIAVELFAEAFGLPLDERLTITGGMPFAGGPWNNYHLHAVGQAILRIRAEQAGAALLTCISGTLSKQAASVWAGEPPAHGYRAVDVTTALERGQRCTVTEAGDASGRIAGYSVLYPKAAAPRLLAVVDTGRSTRTIGDTDDPTVVDLALDTDLVGAPVSLRAGRLELAPAPATRGVEPRV